MPTFQLTLKGYNPNTSKTDHLIKWVRAPHLEAVNEFLAVSDWQLAEPPEQLGSYADDYNTEDGIDILLKP
jgi:hypothetical protein